MKKVGQFTSSDLKDLKEDLEILHRNNKTIHISVKETRNAVVDSPSKIVGVYDRFVCVKSKVKNFYETFTINYIDIKIGKIQIKELIEQADPE